VLIVLAVLFLQLLYIAWPRRSNHGDVIEESYRRTQRLEAHRAWFEHPSDTTRTVFDLEDHRLYRYMAARWGIGLTVVVVVDAICIYWFWRNRSNVGGPD
jgi:hypothetical protein